MSISQFGESGEKPIPAGWALPPDRELSLDSRNAVGNDIITAELQKINHDIETLLELRASLSGYGLAKIAPASLTDATQESDLACGAFEKNAGIPGTLANGTLALRREFEDFVNRRNLFDLGFLTEEQAKNTISVTGSGGAYTVRCYTLSFNSKDHETFFVWGLDTNAENPDPKTYFGIQVAVTGWQRFLLRRCRNAVWTEWETIK